MNSCLASKSSSFCVANLGNNGLFPSIGALNLNPLVRHLLRPEQIGGSLALRPVLALAGVFVILTRDSATLNDITYDELRDALELAGVELTAGELHGAISGLVCATPDNNLRRLWSVLLSGPAPEGALASLADDLAVETAHLLEDRQMGFKPLLPEDDAAINEKAEELARWCASFLAGLGAAGTVNKDAMGEQVGEIVLDFSRISQAGFDEADEDLEEAENAFAEILEYVRVGVQLVYEELAANMDAPDPDITVH